MVDWRLVSCSKRVVSHLEYTCRVCERQHLLLFSYSPFSSAYLRASAPLCQAPFVYNARMGEERLITLVTRDAMIGTAAARSAEAAP